MFQFAMKEYAQTVPPNNNNNDSADDELYQESAYSEPADVEDVSSPSAAPNSNCTTYSSSSSDHHRARQHTTANSTATAAANMERSPSLSCFYEEQFGEAYTGGLISYVYPSGYQSMRPRSCPWKLSLVVCILFTWLSIFIVGHCSDQNNNNNTSSSNYNYNDDDQNNANNNAAVNDDAAVLDTRWCGSRTLYLLWVASMLITGLAASYCSIIGYIKVRDFAVANTRSQPCGNNDGSGSPYGVSKSDYYVRISSGSYNSDTVSEANSTYRPSIYQSDGTPQFWGAHIYRPTQAAVAVTSR
jgi:hypothetical protein